VAKRRGRRRQEPLRIGFYCRSFETRAAPDVKHSYHKILNIDEGRALNESVSNLMNNELNVVVYNFVDMLSHARTDMQMIRELASDDAAYRSLTLSWFEHSPLFDLLKFLASKQVRV
jgi:D-mannonate dehydratase